MSYIKDFALLYLNYMHTETTSVSGVSAEKIWQKAGLHKLDSDFSEMNSRSVVLFFLFIISEGLVFDASKKTLLKSDDFKRFKYIHDPIQCLKSDRTKIKNCKTHSALLKEWYMKNISDFSFYSCTRCLFKDNISSVLSSSMYSLPWQKIHYIYSNIQYTEEQKEYITKFCETEKSERG